MSDMPYYSRLVGGLLLYLVLVLLKFTECSKLSSLLVQFKLLVGEPSHQSPCGKLNVLPPNLVVAVASALWTGLLFLHYNKYNYQNSLMRSYSSISLIPTK